MTRLLRMYPEPGTPSRRGNERRDIVWDDTDRLAAMTERRLRLYAYVLIRNQFHFAGRGVRLWVTTVESGRCRGNGASVSSTASPVSCQAHSLD